MDEFADLKKMSENSSCIFCRIIAGVAEAHRVHEDDLSLAILDINPLAEGHCLVIPKRHVPWWHDLTKEEIESLFSVARAVANKIMLTFQPDFVCMYARGRRIPHTHIFLVPTKKGDPLDRFFNALEGFQEAPPEMMQLRESMKETAERLGSATEAGVKVIQAEAPGMFDQLFQATQAGHEQVKKRLHSQGRSD